MPEQRGRRLVDECKQHLLRVMAGIPECAPDGEGAGNAQLEQAAGFALGLSKQDGWLTWSLLERLANDGLVEVLQRGPRAKRFYRLRPG